MNSFSHYHDRLAQKLTVERYAHSVAVAKTALALAEGHGVHKGLAYLAGLLHDYARDLPSPVLEELVKTAGISLDPITRVSPQVWHGKVGAFLVEKELGLKEPRLLQAITNHTLGKPGMSDLDKIIFLADLVEPGRSFPGVESLKELAFSDLSEAMLMAYELSIRHLLDNKAVIHPNMVEARNELILSLRTEGDEIICRMPDD